MGSGPTIRKRLLVGLITVVAALWCVLFYLVYQAAQSEVEGVFDATLAQEARVLATLLTHEAEEETAREKIFARLASELGDDALSRSKLLMQLVEKYGKNGGHEEREDYLTLMSPGQSSGHRYEFKMAFLASYGNKHPILRSPNAPSFNIDREGFYNLDNMEDGWRVYGIKLPKSGLLVHVGERLSVRIEIVNEILMNSLWPMFLSLPILALVIWISVGKGLRPLYQVAERVERRDPNSLNPIPIDSVPGEVVPIVDSLNRLFQRVGRALENERRFTANAAHELRTPLAALKTQAQVKQLDNNHQEHADFLENVVNGVDRTTHLMEQLLALARADSMQRDAILSKKIDLDGVVKNVLSMMNERALNKQIELSLNSPETPVDVQGDEATLGVLVRNLVDNGILYTPAGGKVRVQLQRDSESVSLVVEDNGPGIVEEKRDELFQRFQRGENIEAQGSGLGLSIVKQIADLHGASVSMANIAGGSGLCVTVSFPNYT
jgi:two-component system sensor histidine kinase QseC